MYRIKVAIYAIYAAIARCQVFESTKKSFKLAQACKTGKQLTHAVVHACIARAVCI